MLESALVSAHDETINAYRFERHANIREKRSS